jgi:hypothetical protein
MFWRTLLLPYLGSLTSVLKTEVTGFSKDWFVSDKIHDIISEKSILNDCHHENLKF